MMLQLIHMKLNNSMVVYGIIARFYGIIARNVVEMDDGCACIQTLPIAQMKITVIQHIMSRIRHHVVVPRTDTVLITDPKNQLIGIVTTTLGYEFARKHALDLEIRIHQDRPLQTHNLIGMFLFGHQHPTSHRRNCLF